MKTQTICPDPRGQTNPRERGPSPRLQQSSPSTSPSANPLSTNWQEALRNLRVALDSGLGIEAPLSVLAETALATLKSVQDSRPAHSARFEEAGADEPLFPSWSVRSRLKHNDKSRNYIRLPERALLTESEDAATLASTSDLPAFLQSRELSDALLLVSMEGGARTVQRDATVLQCVVDVLGVPAHRPTSLGGIKSDTELVASARRREIAAIVEKHRVSLMSEDVIAKMARLEQKNGHWYGALRLLNRALLEDSLTEGNTKGEPRLATGTIAKTSPMITTGIEIYAAARQWELALKLMQSLPGSLWRETELNFVVRGLAKSRDADSWAHALKVLNEAVEVHKVPMSKPSTVNHLLGMLGRANQQEEAAKVLERFVRMDSSKAPSASSNYFGEESGPLAPTCTEQIGEQKENTSNDQGNTTKVEANAHTITQLCVAFRHQWQQALTFAGAIIARNKHNPRIVDGVALAKLSLVCSEASLWREALKVVELSEETHTPMDPASYAAISKLVAEQAGGSDSSTSYVAACIRRHHSPEVFSKVLNTVMQTVNIPPPSSNESLPEPAEDERLLQLLDMHYQTLMANHGHVESASLQRLLEAHCKNGDWVSGLRFLNQLQARNAATTAGHDAVQYSMLEPKAPLRPPKWELAVEVYDSLTGCRTMLSDESVDEEQSSAEEPQQRKLTVAISEVAFRSCLRLCFSQGATDAAQKLLRTTMKRGIGGIAKR